MNANCPNERSCPSRRGSYVGRSHSFRHSVRRYPPTTPETGQWCNESVTGGTAGAAPATDALQHPAARGSCREGWWGPTPPRTTAGRSAHCRRPRCPASSLRLSAIAKAPLGHLLVDQFFDFGRQRDELRVRPHRQLRHFSAGSLHCGVGLAGARPADTWHDKRRYRQQSEPARTGRGPWQLTLSPKAPNSGVQVCRAGSSRF